MSQAFWFNLAIVCVPSFKKVDGAIWDLSEHKAGGDIDEERWVEASTTNDFWRREYVIMEFDGRWQEPVNSQLTSQNTFTWQ